MKDDELLLLSSDVRHEQLEAAKDLIASFQ